MTSNCHLQRQRANLDRVTILELDVSSSSTGSSNAALGCWTKGLHTSLEQHTLINQQTRQLCAVRES